MFLAFQIGVKNIQTAGYNGARTVYTVVQWTFQPLTKDSYREL